MMTIMDKPSRIILVTGGAGFIGSNFLNHVVKKYPDDTFINLDALTYAGNLDNIEVPDADNYAFEKCDIRDTASLLGVFEKYTPTQVVHFAAETHVDNSITSPDIFLETNILGTHNLLKLSREYQVERFLHISTDEVYGSLQRHDLPFTENDPLKPNSPYSSSKAAAEMIVRAYQHTFGLPTLVTRCGNNYGPHQHFEKLIPLSIKKLMNGEAITLYGNGENIRDWIYVQDHVEAIDLILHRGIPGELYNIGGVFEHTNNEIAQRLIALYSSQGSVEYIADRLGHDFRYALDISKIKSELGWTPRINFEQGLQETFKWYKAKLQ